MSDIGIMSDPLSIAILYLIFGSPGIVLGAIAGALVWRVRRIWGAALGAVVGWAVCIGVVWVFFIN